MTTQPTPISDALTIDRVPADPIQNATINGVWCDPDSAERVLAAIPGVFEGPHRASDYRRFDEVLYRSPAGWYFAVRPLDPDEAWEWMLAVDDVEARQRFPDRRRPQPDR